MENKKYELTGEMFVYKGKELHMIKALRDFGSVKKGDLGGWIEKESNLSHEGDCWICHHGSVYGNAEVSGDAMVGGTAEAYDNARVYGNAQVYGSAKVYGNAIVYGDASVYGNAQVYGDASVYGNAEVSGDAMVFGNTRAYDNAIVYGDASVYGNAEVFGNTRVFDRNINFSTDVTQTHPSKSVEDSIMKITDPLHKYVGGITVVYAPLSNTLSVEVGGEHNPNMYWQIVENSRVDAKLIVFGKEVASFSSTQDIIDVYKFIKNNSYIINDEGIEIYTLKSGYCISDNNKFQKLIIDPFESFKGIYIRTLMYY